MEQVYLDGIRMNCKSLTEKQEKIMKIKNELRPRSDVARIYVSRRRGGRGLISCKCCVRGEENSLSWCILNSREVLLSIKYQMSTKGLIARQERTNGNRKLCMNSF